MSKTTSGSYLGGKLLIAMPTMADTRFHKAVILLCAHDKNGAMGLMINHTIAGIEFEHLLEQLGITSDIEVDFSKYAMQVMNGGPVESSRGFLLHSNDFLKDDTIKISENFSVTGTVEALRDVAKGEGPNKVLFILGYAGWNAGQLEQELQQNAWLVVDPDPSIIFNPQHDQKWSRAIGKLGIDPGMLSGDVGRA